MPDTRPITDRLREDTRDLHTRAEKGPLQAALVRGELPREVYADMLEQMRQVHEALERELEARRGEVPAIESVVSSEQYRLPHIEADLAFYGRSRASIEPLPATRRVVEHIERLSRERPLALLGLHYVLEGSNNGNRFIARKVAEGYGLEGEDGLRTLRPYGDRQPQVWEAFKENLAACELSETDMDALGDAAKAMFQGVIEIHDELHARHADQPA